MIKIGFVTSPLTSGHAVRGVGYYTQRLFHALSIQCSRFNVQLFEIKNPLDVSHWKLDIVHYPFFDFYTNTLSIIRNTKTIVTIHDLIPLEFPEHFPPGIRGSINLKLQKLSLNAIDGVITDSYASVKAIHQYLGIDHTKIKLIYLAADDHFKPIKDKQKLNAVAKKYNLPQRFVLYVGDVNWNKNIPGLIEACKLSKLSLVLVGKHAQEVEKLDLNHPELRHLKTVDWQFALRLGFVPDEDMPALYNLAAVYCQASFAEGFGLPVLEAMACGTQVACSNTHSLPEIAGDAAEYFNPYDQTTIAKAITKSLTTKHDVVSQASKFSWEKTASKTLEVYISV